MTTTARRGGTPGATRVASLVVAAGLVAAAGLLSGCAAKPLPLGATAQARALHEIWVTFFWAGIGVMLVVYGLIAWCVFRYRKRPAQEIFPEQFRRNNRWEVFYTAVPIVMVIGLFLITYPAERHVETIAQHQDVVVDVTGFRWSWRFAYPELGVSVVGTPDAPPEFVLPLGETARLNVTSVDVDHSFWVPAFLFKRDAIPGLQNVFDWTPTKPGLYRGECGEFCGLDHARMSFAVRVVPRPEFERWVASHRGLARDSARHRAAASQNAHRETAVSENGHGEGVAAAEEGVR